MLVVGVDEAGRGCWAGPLVVAVVALADPIPGLADSKRLNRLRRQELAASIKREATALGVGWVSAKRIDEIGLTLASGEAMRQALEAADLSKHTITEIILDGKTNYLPSDERIRCVIKADATVPAVSAASIIAKTERDAYMLRMSERHPQYQFDKHVGYGTALHSLLLKKHGICELHRRSYKPIIALQAQASV